MEKKIKINEKALKHISAYIKNKFLLSLWYIRDIVGSMSLFKPKIMPAGEARKRYNASETGSKEEYIYCQAVIQSIRDIDDLIAFFEDEILENKELYLFGFIKRAVEIIKTDMVNKNVVNNHFLRLHTIIRKTTLRPITDNYFTYNYNKAFVWIRQQVHFREISSFFFSEWMETAHYGEEKMKCLKIIFDNTSVYDPNHLKARGYLIKLYREEIRKQDRVRHLDIYINKISELQSHEMLETLFQTAIRLCYKDTSLTINDEIRRLYVLLSPTDIQGMASLTRAIISRKQVYFRQDS